MSLTKLVESPNPPSSKPLNQNRPTYAYETNRIIDEIERNGITTTGNVSVGGDLTVTGITTLNGNLVLGDAAADSLTVNATTTYGDPINYSNQTGITAFATGGQASATALTEEINNITTVATAGDSVKLPAAVAGKHVHVKNSGATALDIFPASADSIDALAVNLAIRIQPGSSVDFYAKDATVWESNVDQSFTLVAPTTNRGRLEIKAADNAANTVVTVTNASQAGADRIYTIPDAGTNAEFVMGAGAQNIAGVKTFTDTTDSTTKDTGAIVIEGGIGVEKSVTVGTNLTYGSLLTEGLTTGITAFATGGQAGATALTKSINNVTVCATAGDSVKLPAAVAGISVTVKNSGATALDIFPASGDSIDALAVDLAIRIQPGSVVTFKAIDGIVWESNVDQSFTLVAPTTNTGQLELKATSSAGNTVTTITNASQAAARTYTIPDAGANADFIMGQGAQTVDGAKDFVQTTNFRANITLAKEVDHTVTVTNTTTADTAGGAYSTTAGKGVGTGAGGAYSALSGQGGATANGGSLSITSGAGGATSGDSGLVTVQSGAGSATSGASANVDIKTGNATLGGTGDVTVTTGNTASGLAGDIILTTGTGTSTTVVPVIKMVNGVQRDPGSSDVASGGTITAVQLVRGLIRATGGTGNWTLPAAADIVTALGSVQRGTNFEFVFNASEMTATNTATLVVGAGMTVPSAPAITGGATLTVTQDTQVTAGFRVVFDTTTTCKIYRIW